jgi:hypothetical protein
MRYLTVAVPAWGGHLAGAGSNSPSGFEVTDGVGVVGYVGAVWGRRGGLRASLKAAGHQPRSTPGMADVWALP